MARQCRLTNAGVRGTGPDPLPARSFQDLGLKKVDESVLDLDGTTSLNSRSREGF